MDVSQHLGGLLRRETLLRKWQNKNASCDMRKETGENRESAAERLLMVPEGAVGERTWQEAWGRRGNGWALRPRSGRRDVRGQRIQEG